MSTLLQREIHYYGVFLMLNIFLEPLSG